MLTILSSPSTSMSFTPCVFIPCKFWHVEKFYANIIFVFKERLSIVSIVGRITLMFYLLIRIRYVVQHNLTFQITIEIGGLLNA
jgi:hypothetical protein